MTEKSSTCGLGRHGSSPDFSLFAGGPLYRLIFQGRQPHGSARLALPLGVALLAWLPLLLLSAAEGQVLTSNIPLPFLQDLEAHVRLLLALPLLLFGALVTSERVRRVPSFFVERDLIPEAAVAKFEGAVDSAIRLRNSFFAEGLLIVFVYGVGILIWWRYVAVDAGTWYAASSAEGSRLTFAGMWYAWVSLPLFQFILCRWYFRLFIWARFLWQISRIELKLVATHPDRVAGLSFLSSTVQGLAVFATAHGTLLAGYLSTRVVILGTPLIEFKAEIAAMVVLVLCVALGPLLVFAVQLSAAKRSGLHNYGSLATRYVREFEAKWIRGGAASAEPLIGSADIQSLADLANSYDIVRGVRMAPITMDTIQRLTLATLAPIAPLVLTMVPAADLTKNLARILF